MVLLHTGHIGSFCVSARHSDIDKRQASFCLFMMIVSRNVPLVAAAGYETVTLFLDDFNPSPTYLLCVEFKQWLFQS